ncbi:hypothetical protein BDV96DRAFT_606843 [Lophiotrema nucula]|uniref:Uncharacterized protein n=1 Tax=Lophiotrema nucula TaxID=690887 RepID=A0A6A5YJ85_9PLEO|nr:hypothetical protein BDV96DRAFT_606843 [Lophiotrema nucula]
MVFRVPHRRAGQWGQNYPDGFYSTKPETEYRRWPGPSISGYLGRKAPPPQPSYQRPTHPKEHTLAFVSEEQWEAEKLKSGIQFVCFMNTFPITSEHILAVSKASEEFRDGLLGFYCGDTRRGATNSVSSAAVAALAKACPNLKYIRIEGISEAFDEGLGAILESCTNLESLVLGAPDIKKPNFTLKLETIERLANEDLCMNLKYLEIAGADIDDPQDYEFFEYFSGLRKTPDKMWDIGKSLEIVKVSGGVSILWREGSVNSNGKYTARFD